MSNIAELADKLAAAAHEVSQAWDADSGKATDRFIRSLTNLEDAHEDYIFMRREMKVRVANENKNA